MKLSRFDYLLTVGCNRFAFLFKHMGDMETLLLDKKLNEIRITTPVFITGLARSGTTVLLELFAKAGGVATHRYRDFPLVMSPYFWALFLDRFSKKQDKIERPHKDRIKISKESPEAFEEIIWKYFFPFIHSATERHVITENQTNPEFEEFFIAHIKKILLLRQGNRYVSKGNYNITRIEYLSRLFPDAFFIIPIRHPLNHINSLVRQHKLFNEYTQNDSRIPNYLGAAGHYEFGPQRIPINITGEAVERIENAWGRGDDDTGYAIQWAEVYNHVNQLLHGNTRLAQRIFIVRYEDFCEKPKKVVENLLVFTNLIGRGKHILDNLDYISASPHKASELPDSVKEKVWKETSVVAASFGYNQNPLDPEPQ